MNCVRCQPVLGRVASRVQGSFQSYQPQLRFMMSRPTILLESFGDYASDAAVDDNTRPIHRNHGSLPHLPVPTLQETVNTFLPTALPLAESKEEADSLTQACQRFPAQAAKLQQRLLARQSACSDTSWLQQWWNQLGYLQDRNSNAIHMSYFFRESDAASHMTGLERGALVLQTAALYAQSLQDNPMPEPLSQKLTLCSTQYKYLFSACRVPRPKQDSYRVYELDYPMHAAVGRKYFSALNVTSQL